MLRDVIIKEISTAMYIIIMT